MSVTEEPTSSQPPCEICGAPATEYLDFAGVESICEPCHLVLDDAITVWIDENRDKIVAARRQRFGNATELVYRKSGDGYEAKP